MDTSIHVLRRRVIRVLPFGHSQMTGGIFATRARGESEAGAVMLHTKSGTGVAPRTEDGGARAGVNDYGGS